MKTKIGSIMLVLLGVGLLSAGLVLLKTAAETQGILQVLPYVCIGLGCGAFGHGAGEWFNNRTLARNPALARSVEIEKNDERNKAIADRARSKAFGVMIPVFGALLVSFALMGVETAAVLLLTAAYLFVCGYSVYFHTKLDKEM